MYVNIMWLDALYILPILTYLTLEAAGYKPFRQTDISDNDSNIKKVPVQYALSTVIKLSLTYTYLFITNFYMAYMVVIFETAVFILTLFALPDGRDLRSLAKIP